MAYSVTQRQREMGIGIAFGATQHDLLAMILADGLGCGLFGIYFGLASAFAATRLLLLCSEMNSVHCGFLWHKRTFMQP